MTLRKVYGKLPILATYLAESASRVLLREKTLLGHKLEKPIVSNYYDSKLTNWLGL